MYSISKACGRTTEEVTEKAKRDFWLSADEAKGYGLIERIVTKKSELWRSRR